MRHLRAALARVAGVFTGHRADDDLDEELQAHLEMETAEYIKRGMSPDAARRKAMLTSGGLTQAGEAVRERRGLPWLESIVSDVGYALRSLRHSPAFTAVVVVTLALGIGANTAIFSVVRGVLLKPLPHREGDRLVYVRQLRDGPQSTNILFSVPEIRDFRNQAKSFAGIAEYSPWFYTLQGDTDAVRIDVGLVTGNYFDVMGLSPALGRMTNAGDDGAHAPPVMVLAHDFWMRRFGGDSSIVGTRVNLDGLPVTVIGVSQPAPYFPGRMDALLNMVASEHHLSALMTEGRSHRMTEMVARLAPAATLEQARAEVETAHARMMRTFPKAYGPGSHYRIAVIPYREALGERARLTVWLLMAAAAFVMIISVANVVNLTLMRGVRREPELMVRAALGAGVSRLRRLLLVENLVLTFLGAILGVVIAIGGVRLLIALAERYSPRANEIRVDVVVLGFTLALSVAVALLLSFAAFIPREGTLASIVSAGTRRMSRAPTRQRLRRTLVVAQVAVSVVLLAGAGLLTRTMIHLSDVDSGLESDEVLTMPVSLIHPERLSPATDSVAKEMYERMRQELRALPGVKEVGIGSAMPLRRTPLGFDFKTDGQSRAAGEAMPHASFRTASPEYFRAAGIPLLKGREFSGADDAGAPRVAIVNKTLADTFFPGVNAVGKRIAFTGDVLQFTPVRGDWREIVGVVGNTQDGGLDAAPRYTVFIPFRQELVMLGGFVIRAESNASGLAAAVRRVVHRLAPNVPVDDVMTVRQIKDQSISPRRLNAALISSFGILAVMIAAVGIAGVLAFSVSARTHEIGIRMSLGADRGDVWRMIMKEGGVLLATGVVLGVIGAFLAGGVMQGLLFGVAPQDPATLVGVAVLMAAVGLAACWIPARRAARIDPAAAMRA